MLVIFERWVTMNSMVVCGVGYVKKSLRAYIK